MITRRSFVAAAVMAGIALPGMAHAVTEMSATYKWPEIQGPGVDPKRTRFISGRGIRTELKNSEMIRPDLRFDRSAEANPSMAFTHGVVLARAASPDLPLVAMDAATGKLAWERDQTLKLLGVGGKTAFIVTAPVSDQILPILKAIDVTGPTDIWAVGEGEILGAVVIPEESIVYLRQLEDNMELVSRDIASGKVLWTTDVNDALDSDAILSTDGQVVVGVNVTTNISRYMNAWDATTGELLWSNEGPGYISAPAFRNNELLIATMEGINLIDPATGEILQEIDLPANNGGLVQLIITEDALVIVDSERFHSVDWASGKVNWSHAPEQAASATDVYACDGKIYRIEKSAESSGCETTLRGYSLKDGSLEVEYLPVNSERTQLSATAFLIGAQHLFLGTEAGLGNWSPSEKA